MKINIHAPWPVNQHLERTIRQKLEKLHTYYDRIVHADVFLKLKETATPNDKLVEIRLRIPGPELFADGNADTYEKAVTKVAEKIKKQLIKRKEKLSNR